MAAIEEGASSITEDFKLLDGDASEAKVVEEEAPKKEKAQVLEVEEEEEEAVADEVEELEVKDEEEPDTKELLPHERPTMEQIKKKFPEFFKTFPTLQAAFNRERQFSEVFHTPADAADAAKSVEDYELLRSDIIEGDGSKFIPALKESDSLKKFSSNFLPNLYKADKDLHWQTILPILEDMVRFSYKEGIRSKNENLSNSALHLAEFLLGDEAIAEGKKTLVNRTESKADEGIGKKEQEYENRRFNDFNIDVHESLYDSLVSEIDKGFKTEDGLTDFMKTSVRKETIDQVVKAIKEDKEFTRYKDKLWKEAKSNGYRNDDKSRILNASLARAKSLIPSVRRRLIGEALGSSPLEADKRRERAEVASSRREPGSQGRAVSVKGKVPSPKAIDYRRTSDMDILNDNFTLKGQK